MLAFKVKLRRAPLRAPTRLLGLLGGRGNLACRRRRLHCRRALAGGPALTRSGACAAEPSAVLLGPPSRLRRPRTLHTCLRRAPRLRHERPGRQSATVRRARTPSPASAGAPLAPLVALLPFSSHAPAASASRSASEEAQTSGCALQQLVEAVTAGGHGNHREEIGARRLNVARRVAHHADLASASPWVRPAPGPCAPPGRSAPRG